MHDIHLSVLFFAYLKEKTGTAKCQIVLKKGANIKELKEHLIRHYPLLELVIDHTVVAVNRKYVPDEQILMDNDEVAFFPPVSGGAEGKTIARITTKPLDLDALVTELTQSTTGAVCAFIGTVRGTTVRGKPHKTARLEYEAYIPMAEEKMFQIVAEIRQRWVDVEGVALVQRIGMLEAGSVTIAILCTAAHRDAGVFEAARFGIDRLKEIVPIWKKEVGPGGEVWVEGEYRPREGD